MSLTVWSKGAYAIFAIVELIVGLVLLRLFLGNSKIRLVRANDTYNAP